MATGSGVMDSVLACCEGGPGLIPAVCKNLFRWISLSAQEQLGWVGRGFEYQCRPKSFTSEISVTKVCIPSCLH